jgi:hypothetical protein
MKRTWLPIGRTLSARLWIAASGTAFCAGLLAFQDSARLSAQESPLHRSAEPRPRLADERQLPRQRERATHHGFEVNTGPIVVIATTRLEDARQAAEQATAAWGHAAALADHWTSVHRQPNFAQGAVHVVLKDDRASDRDGASAVLANAGRATQIVVRGVGRAGASEEHQRHLRQHVARAFFHIAELDRTFPEWVSDGLAAYVAGNQSDESSADDPAARVRFLLEGNDGRHAGPFFDLLRQQLASVRPEPDRVIDRGNRSKVAQARDFEAVEQFVEKLADEFAQWQQDPLLGQPQLAPEDGFADALQAARQEMAFVLKLTDRFAAPERSGVRTKVATYDKTLRNAVAVTHAAAGRPQSLAGTWTRMSAAGQPTWATMGPDGKLIWSHEEDKFRKLLGMDEHRYQVAWQENQWVLETTLADGRKLRGWLERNAENPHRLLAKFAVASPK